MMADRVPATMRHAVRTVTSAGPGGVMARALLPAAVVIPVILGCLQWVALRGGWASMTTIVIVRTALIMLILFAVIWSSARSLNRLDEERTRAEEANRRYARFFSLSVEMFGISGFDGSFKHVSPGWSRVLGYTTDEILAVPYAEFIHPDDRARLREILPLVRDGRPHEAIEIRYRHKNGSYRWLSWNVVAIPEEQITYAVARDITPLKEATAQLEAVNRELDGFARSVSHDLRAPVRAVDGFAQLLEEDHAAQLDEEGRRLLAVVRRSSRNMGQLIDDLLSFSRVSRQQREPVWVAMRELARAAASDARAAEPGRTIEVDLGELPDIEGDRAMLRQVWVNLLSNAVKYTRCRPAATIRVTGEVREGFAHYVVADNGTGFDPRFQDKLFGVFQRLHAAEEYEGTGVGLALVKRIVERHGGVVGAEGEPGRGATFSFALPVGSAPGGAG
jgi:PAS domain S-box-containing protein